MAPQIWRGCVYSREDPAQSTRRTLEKGRAGHRPLLPEARPAVLSHRQRAGEDRQAGRWNTRQGAAGRCRPHWLLQTTGSHNW